MQDKNTLVIKLSYYIKYILLVSIFGALVCLDIHISRGAPWSIALMFYEYFLYK